MDIIKQIPYGITDFERVMKGNYYYVDKSMFVERMEKVGSFLFLVRPRRFGKSLFLSMLEAYYDINKAKDFEQLFRGLYIAEHPTENRNKYQVLYLDFSRVGSDLEKLDQNFNAYCGIRLNDFMQYYGKYYDSKDINAVLTAESATDKFNIINGLSKRKGFQLYLIVDEYDNFTNNVLNEKGQKAYHNLTHGSGFYRDIFKIFKGMFDRVLMLGVSPITLDDLTSGYNIALNITMDSRFNQMLGFSESDIRKMVGYYHDLGAIKQSVDDTIADMKPWYDNYCFSADSYGNEPTMFNCDMVCYYLNYLIGLHKRPHEMIDPNTKTDYKKLRNLVEVGDRTNERHDIINEIVSKGYILGTVNSYFPAESITEESNFISLLYYYGMLTIGGVYGALLKLCIPNNNVRLQYYGYLRQLYQEIKPLKTSSLDIAFFKMAMEGDWKPVLQLILQAYHDTTSIRQLIEGERNLQGFMNAYLSLNPYYIIAPELELNHGYCDFFLLPDAIAYPMVKHSYILELKYLKESATDEEASRQWNEAIKQIRDYAKDKNVEKMLHQTQLHLIIVQIKGYSPLKYEEV